MTNARRHDAILMLRRLVGQHDNSSKDGDHEWRECRVCIARDRLDDQFLRDLFRELADELEARWLR